MQYIAMEIRSRRQAFCVSGLGRYGGHRIETECLLVLKWQPQTNDCECLKCGDRVSRFMRNM